MKEMSLTRLSEGRLAPCRAAFVLHNLSCLTPVCTIELVQEVQVLLDSLTSVSKS